MGCVQSRSGNNTQGLPINNTTFNPQMPQYNHPIPIKPSLSKQAPANIETNNRHFSYSNIKTEGKASLMGETNFTHDSKKKGENERLTAGAKLQKQKMENNGDKLSYEEHQETRHHKANIASTWQLNANRLMKLGLCLRDQKWKGNVQQDACQGSKTCLTLENSEKVAEEEGEESGPRRLEFQLPWRIDLSQLRVTIMDKVGTDNQSYDRVIDESVEEEADIKTPQISGWSPHRPHFTLPSQMPALPIYNHRLFTIKQSQTQMQKDSPSKSSLRYQVP